jgi:hypothetical protein
VARPLQGEGHPEAGEARPDDRDIDVGHDDPPARAGSR